MTSRAGYLDHETELSQNNITSGPKLVFKKDRFSRKAISNCGPTTVQTRSSYTTTLYCLKEPFTNKWVPVTNWVLNKKGKTIFTGPDDHFITGIKRQYHKYWMTSTTSFLHPTRNPKKPYFKTMKTDWAKNEELRL